MRLLLILLGLIIALSGCVSVQRYPNAWPDIAGSLGPGGCLSVIGCYRAVSDPWPEADVDCKESKAIDWGRYFSCVSLPAILHAPSWEIPSSVIIRIEQDADSIRIFGYPVRTLRRGKDYLCVGKHIELIEPKGEESWNIGGGYLSKHWNLYRGSDGSLLAKYTEKAAGYIIVPPMPVIFYYNRWIRWKPAPGVGEPGHRPDKGPRENEEPGMKPQPAQDFMELGSNDAKWMFHGSCDSER